MRKGYNPEFYHSRNGRASISTSTLTGTEAIKQTGSEIKQAMAEIDARAPSRQRLAERVESLTTPAVTLHR